VVRGIVAALGVASVVVGIPSSSAATSCSRTPTVGLEPRVEGAEGRYLLSVPARLRGRAPLLVALHGNPGAPEQEAASWGWESVAPGFIVAYPSRTVHSTSEDTLPQMWDWSRGSRDVKLVLAIIRSIATTYCVDPARIHVTGTSGGAYMAQRLACDAADVVASIGEYAGGRPDVGYQTWGPARAGACTPSRPMPVIMFHGTADTNVPLGHGRSAMYLWGELGGCRASATTRFADGSLTRLAPCRDGVEVVWREYDGDDHFTAAMRHGDEIRRMQLAFFERHRRPVR